MNILDKAAEITSVDRNVDYGPPILNHSCTAALWSVWLNRRLGVDVQLTAEDVCSLNILQKLSRLANKITTDGLIDIAGYARNVEMIRESRTSIDAVGTEGAKATVTVLKP